jgi:hypothetical protein
MSNELLAAVRSDNLPTIAEALVQWLISDHGASMIGNAAGYCGLRWSPGKATFYMRLPLLPERGDQGINDRVWQLLNMCAYNSSIDDVAMSPIVQVLVMKKLTPPWSTMHPPWLTMRARASA